MVTFVQSIILLPHQQTMDCNGFSHNERSAATTKKHNTCSTPSAYGLVCLATKSIDLIRLTRAPTLAAKSNYLRGRSIQLQLLQTILLRALCTFPGNNHQLIQYIDLRRHKKTTLEARRAHSQREVTKFAKALQHCRRAASPQTSLLPSPRRVGQTFERIYRL